MRYPPNGGRWHTRSYVVQGEKLVARGPYRWLKHPNYLTVAVGLLSLRLSFGACFTAVVFTLTNTVLCFFGAYRLKKGLWSWAVNEI